MSREILVAGFERILNLGLPQAAGWPLEADLGDEQQRQQHHNGLFQRLEKYLNHQKHLGGRLQQLPTIRKTRSPGNSIGFSLLIKPRHLKPYIQVWYHLIIQALNHKDSTPMN